MNSITLFNFDKPQEIDQWYSINDGVMGGVSLGSIFQLEPGVAQFRGSVSFENNGGFSSIRTRPLTVSLAGYDGIELRIRGDGKKYKLRLKTNTGPDGLCYEVSFNTVKESWGDVRLSLKEAKAKYRAIKIPFVSQLKSERIKSLGLLISDKQEGSFYLDVDWIKAYKD
ncbi:MAG: CIA30 family protein [Elusimicrobiota bacterium]